MATKLRNYSRHTAVKAASFILFVAFVTALVGTAGVFAYKWEGGNFEDYLAGRPFESSDFLFWEVRSPLSTVLSAAGWHAYDAEYARAEYRNFLPYISDINLKGVRYYVRTPYITLSNSDMPAREYRQRSLWYLQEGITGTASDNLINNRRWSTFPIPYVPEPSLPPVFAFPGLDDPPPYPPGMDTADNLPDDAGYGSFDYDAYYAQQYEFRFCMTDEFYLQLKTEYARNTGVFWRYAAALLLLGLGALACLLHLLLVCGRGFELRLVFMAEDEPGRVSGPLLGKARLSPFWDKPWLDVLLGLTVLYAALAFFELDMLFSLYNIRETVGRFIAYCCILTAPFAALALWWLLSAAKRLKTRSFLKHTLIYTLLAFLFRPVRRLCRAALRLCRAAVNGLPLVWQIGVCSVVYGVIVLLLVAGFVHTPGWLLLFLPMLAVLVTFYFARKMSCLADVGKGIGRLARGDYDTPVPEDGKGLLLEMAKNVNAATDGLKAAVEKELVSQRFKAELITNVSHDLRTPLTSVITYAGLLQSEGLTSPGAPGYLDVIQSKARRLQTLTEDLFEASKASSGETRAELAPLDINQLIEQTLGEFGDRLETARLDVRVSGTCELAMADGRLLCRIFENLLRNIEKYAMPGTRVYIDKAGENGRAVITLRNISAEPLTGNAERLAERFTRGDEARSTEGSGLGLAIVRSLAELQKGTCAIASDGDLFKVTLTLPLA